MRRAGRGAALVLALLFGSSLVACGEAPPTAARGSTTPNAVQALAELERQMQVLVARFQPPVTWERSGEDVTIRCYRPFQPPGSEPPDGQRRRTWQAAVPEGQADRLVASVRGVFDDAGFTPLDVPGALVAAENETGDADAYTWWIERGGPGQVRLIGLTGCLDPPGNTD